MIKTGPGLTTCFIVLSLVVAAGIADGLLGERLGMRLVYHSRGFFRIIWQVDAPLPLCEPRRSARLGKLQDVVSVIGR